MGGKKKAVTAGRKKKKQGRDLAFWEPDEAGVVLRTASGWKPGDPIGYIRKKIPAFRVPAYKGERYQAMVPDTLDLQERASLAVNGLTGPTDPLADFEVYFFVYLLSNPPMMKHSFDSHCQCKFLEALPLMRIISGSELNDEVDRRWMEVVLRQLGPDGLAYTPVKGRPWALLGVEDALPARAKKLDQHVMLFYCGRLLSVMTLYYLREGGPLWRKAAERLVDGLAELAVDRGRYAYYGPHPYWAEKGSTVDPAKHSRHTAMECPRAMVLGLAHMYRETSYEPAIKLAQKLVHYMLEVCHGFDEDGRFNAALLKQAGGAISNPTGPRTTHFHLHTSALQAILEYATVTGEKSLIELVRKGYEYGKANGNVLLGYFPEFVNSDRREHSELCEVADMIALGLKLTDAGAGDYRDDVDRWSRNMFTEGQLLYTDWIDRLHLTGMEETREADVLPSRIDRAYQTTDNVAQRNLGAFAGWPKANDWYAGQGMGIMHCCTGNATRAIYYLWDHILRHENGKLRVNLLLNRVSPWADVDSHIPYTGQVDVKVKQPVELSVRIPEWVTPDKTRCRVAGVNRRLRWKGRYAQVGRVKPGDVVTLSFPVREQTDVVYVEKEKYTLIRKGNEVVSIDPPGKHCPLYQRQHYRANTTRWRKIERFVSKESIHW